ncbi:hypothetical protein IFM89_033152 [Coptis chinensis]|uniref:Oxidative stress 3 n=1 Tax=Coptis chinensis TaxID=261450 RepID=A0A835M5D9_9MAGN|nr:hypothetical protein IFM89_033152 [Coptis chinensis]
MAASKCGIFFDQMPIGINSFTPIDMHNTWPSIEVDDDDICDSTSTMSSSFENSTNSDASSSSLDLDEDASSSTSNSSSFVLSPQLCNRGPLYELSELMAQLPIKRGLSNHFQGKSQSFTSLSNVNCIEDLAKKENPYRKRMKSCKSYGGLDATTNKSYAPKACSKIISKKVSRGSFLSSQGKRSSLNNSPRSPFSLQKDF